MKHHISLHDCAGFVRVGEFVWLIAGGMAIRPDGEYILAIPWNGDLARPYQHVTREGIWERRANGEATLRSGPNLDPVAEQPVRNRRASLFHASEGIECWFETPKRVRQSVLKRTDGVKVQVPPELAREQIVDAAPAGEWTAVLTLEGLRLLKPGNEHDSSLWQPGRPGDRERSWILATRGAEVWVREESVTWHVKNGVVTRIELPLECAGEAFGWRDGAKLRLIDHPLEHHNALRDARYAHVEGLTALVATDDSLLRVEGGKTRVLFRFFPGKGRICALVPGRRGPVVVVTEKDRSFSVFEMDREWKRGGTLEGHVLGAGSDGNCLWILTMLGLFRGNLDNLHIEPVSLAFRMPRKLATSQGRVAIGYKSSILIKESSTAAVVPWKEIPIPHDHPKPYDACFGFAGPFVGHASAFDSTANRASFWNQVWVRVETNSERSGAKRCLGRSLWVMSWHQIRRWTGGSHFETWVNPFRDEFEIREDAGDTDRLWIRTRTEALVFDTRSGKLFGFPPAADADAWPSATLTMPDGHVWVVGRGGLLEVEPGEMEQRGVLRSDLPRPV